MNRITSHETIKFIIICLTKVVKNSFRILHAAVNTGVNTEAEEMAMKSKRENRMRCYDEDGYIQQSNQAPQARKFISIPRRKFFIINENTI